MEDPCEDPVVPIRPANFHVAGLDVDDFPDVDAPWDEDEKLRIVKLPQETHPVFGDTVPEVFLDREGKEIEVGISYLDPDGKTNRSVCAYRVTLEPVSDTEVGGQIHVTNREVIYDKDPRYQRIVVDPARSAISATEREELDAIMQGSANRLQREVVDTVRVDDSPEGEAEAVQVKANGYAEVQRADGNILLEKTFKPDPAAMFRFIEKQPEVQPS